MTAFTTNLLIAAALITLVIAAIEAQMFGTNKFGGNYRIKGEFFFKPDLVSAGEARWHALASGVRSARATAKRTFSLSADNSLDTLDIDPVRERRGDGFELGGEMLTLDEIPRPR